TAGTAVLSIITLIEYNCENTSGRHLKLSKLINQPVNRRLQKLININNNQQQTFQHRRANLKVCISDQFDWIDLRSLRLRILTSV
ncbi:hypothetical protein Mgra_00004597, partial [Meloidogyne graminicola]